MNNGLKKTIGIVLGIIFLVFGVRYFIYSFRDGDPQWFMIVMICGMLLILYYTAINSRNKNDDEENYS
jgi:threonine/homoserine/homoserine lactone efflux protein